MKSANKDIVFRPQRTALAGALALAAGTSVYAEIFAFENDGSFTWDLNEYFDFSKSAADQTPSMSSGHSIYLDFYYGAALRRPSGGAYFTGERKGFGPVQANFLRPLEYGEVLNFLPSAIFGQLYYTLYGLGSGGLPTPADGTQPFYFGVRSASLQRGWVKATFNLATNSVYPISWAYESIPEKSIKIGELPPEGSPPCNEADLAQPFGQLDAFDLFAFSIAAQVFDDTLNGVDTSYSDLEFIDAFIISDINGNGDVTAADVSGGPDSFEALLNNGCP